MAWTGKFIGGVLGSLLGPLGTVVGLGIGHQFDKGADRVRTTGQTIQVAFFGCLAKMARADGTVSKAEIDAVEQIFQQLGYTGEMREAAITVFRRAKDDPHMAADYLNQLSGVIQFNRQIAMTFISALHAVAQADGIIHPNERQILLEAERIFRLPSGTIDALLGSTRASDLDEAYRVLECTASMSDDEIKRIYRKKCIEFHPDKLASKGLPDEFMKYAQEQLARVNDAYDTIKKSRNGH